MKAVVYSAATGEILRTVDCPEDHLALQAGEGEQVLAGSASDETHHVAAGALVAYTPEQAARKAARPAWAGAWSNTAMDWTDPRTLAERRAEKWAQIKAERDAREKAGFPYLGHPFDSDPLSVQRISIAAQVAAAATLPFQIAWTAQDNAVVALDAAGMLGMSAALAAHGNTLHQTARALREQIDAATTPEQLEAIAWPAT